MGSDARTSSAGADAPARGKGRAGPAVPCRDRPRRAALTRTAPTAQRQLPSPAGRPFRPAAAAAAAADPTADQDGQPERVGTGGACVGDAGPGPDPPPGPAPSESGGAAWRRQPDGGGAAARRAAGSGGGVGAMPWRKKGYDRCNGDSDVEGRSEARAGSPRSGVAQGGGAQAAEAAEAELRSGGERGEGGGVRAGGAAAGARACGGPAGPCGQAGGSWGWVGG